MKCVIFAVDQAERSGWSLYGPNGFMHSSVAVTAEHRREAVDAAIYEAVRTFQVPLVPVFEQHRKHKGRTVATALSLHRTLGRWLEQLELVGQRKYLTVPIATWRSHHGFGKGVTKPELVRAAEEIKPTVSDDNEAEAILIGAWACQSKEVQAFLPKRSRRL